jgi:acyl-CoA hydrolase
VAGRKTKYPKESALFNQRRKVRYEYLNSLGKMHGGNIYQIMDELAASVAESHSGTSALTRFDAGSFVEQVSPTDTLMLCAYITGAWKSSMDITVQAYKIIREENKERKILVANRTYIFVALTKEGKSEAVPILQPETAEEEERMKRAQHRRLYMKIVETLLEPPLFTNE